MIISIIYIYTHSYTGYINLSSSIETPPPTAFLRLRWARDVAGHGAGGGRLRGRRGHHGHPTAGHHPPRGVFGAFSGGGVPLRQRVKDW